MMGLLLCALLQNLCALCVEKANQGYDTKLH